MNRILPTLFRGASRLARNEGGNVGMLVAISIVPLTLGSLGALDLTHSLTAKVELQDALDAAALAAARTAGSDSNQLQAIGAATLAQNLSAQNDITLTNSSFTFGTGGLVIASANGTVNPMLGKLVGSGQMNISASNQVTRQSSMLEIALVLDNTGSMNDPLNGRTSKISELRTAASSFVDTMATAAAQSSASNPVRISLVPFADTVNVGSTYASATWMDWAGNSPSNKELFTTGTGSNGAPIPGTTAYNRGTLLRNLNNTAWGGCVEMRNPDTTTNGVQWDIDDSPPDTANPKSLFVPYFSPDEADPTTQSWNWQTGSWVTVSQPNSVNNNDNDYVPDPGTLTDPFARQGDTTKYSKTPKTTLNSSTGPNSGCTTAAIQRLTTNFTSLKSQINALVAGGNTNIPMGLMWGWHTLSPNAPFADGVAYNTTNYKKVVVLMTDGQNTVGTSNTINGSPYSGIGYIWQGHLVQADGTRLTAISQGNASAGQYALDDRLQKLCTNMKSPAHNIEIFTIGVGVSTYSQTLLQSCATDANHYFNVTSGANLTPTFQAIANQIAALHLSH